MENNFGCRVMAEAIQAIMTMANFSGFIKQEGGPLRQFEVSTIDGNEERAALYFTFAGEAYKAEISIDSQPEVE